MVESDVFNFKSLLATLSAPLTFILGIVGWHYRSVATKVDSLEDSHQKLQIMVAEHNIGLAHINQSVDKLDNKIDYILEKLDLMR